MYDKKTLVEALVVISEICQNSEFCETCPMYSDSYEDCLIQEKSPEDWKIVTVTAPWRAII